MGCSAVAIQKSKMLTRESIRTGTYLGSSGLRRWSIQRIEDSLQELLTQHDPKNPIWLFAYGSFGIKRNEGGTLLFHRHSDKRFPIARIRKRLAAYGWRGERLNKEVALIVAGPMSSLTGGITALFSLTDGRRSS